MGNGSEHSTPAAAQARDVLLQRVGGERVADQRPGTARRLHQHVAAEARRHGLPRVAHVQQLQIVEGEADDGVLGAEAGMLPAAHHREAKRPEALHRRLQVGDGEHNVVESGDHPASPRALGLVPPNASNNSLSPRWRRRGRGEGAERRRPSPYPSSRKQERKSS